jgi:hypothetical protein
MRGKKRPTAERAHAVGVALLDGATAASRATGIAESTIREWIPRPEFAELRERTKDMVADEWWAGVQHGFRRVIEGFDDEADIQRKATAAAILFDKIAMLRGEAIVRTESTLLQGRSDHEQQLLADILNRELERRADSHDPSHQGADSVAQPEAREADPA